MKKRSSYSDHHRIATRGDLIFCIAIACVTTLLFALLVQYADIPPLYSALPIVFVYLLVVTVWAGFRRTSVGVDTTPVLDMLTKSEFGAVMSSLRSPAFLLDKNGYIIWANTALTDAYGKQALPLGSHISLLLNPDLLLPQTPLEASDGQTEQASDILKLGDRFFLYEAVNAEMEGEKYTFILLNDCTEREYWHGLYSDEREVLAYIAIDNIDETLQSVREQFHSKVLDVENVLHRWASEMNGVLRAYERNRYMVLFSTKALQNACANRFDILDRVRSVRVGDGLPITISLGVSDVSGTLAERDRAAQIALDMALLRGGDQAAYKSDDGVDFYGGKTKTGFKRANVRARVVANQLAAYMVRADHVLIMGHRFGDFDSFGAAVGMARFAMHCGANVHIVANLRDKNLVSCFERMGELNEYKGIFLDAAEGLDMMTTDTLLVIVDVNNFNHVESPEVASKAEKIVVIDHHRKTAEFDEQVLLEYIEPSVSSASELVAEMIQQHLPSGALREAEAESLFSGILLDTKQFTRNTGSRTFSVAAFLRNEGANLSNTSEFFKNDLDDLLKEARFNTNVVLYRERIVLSTCEGETDESYRVIAAKAADKLLNLRGVDAAFALVFINGRIHISARSNGTINVQLILEQLEGGGHYDMAGAQVSGMTMQEALAQLRAAIDTQLDR